MTIPTPEAWRSNGAFSNDEPLQLVWDSTSLGLFKECPRKYYYTMIEGWRSKKQSAHLTFGIAFHGALELYDKLRLQERKGHSESVLEAVKFCFISTATNNGDGTASPWTTDLSNKNLRTLVRTVVWYLEHFREDPAQTVVLSNGKPAVELSFKFDPGVRKGHLLAGHLDRLVTFADRHYVMDRKTTGGALSSHYFAQYSPDNQMTLYTLAGQVVYGFPTSGVIIDAAQVQVQSTRYARGITHRTTAQLEEWLEELNLWLTLAEQYVEARKWPMNEKSCGAFGGCVFRDICGRDPKVRHSFLASDFESHQWDPTKER